MQSGDVLEIPSRSVTVNVVGEVLNSSSHLHKEGLSVSDYINLSGGMTRGADKNRIFIILPDFIIISFLLHVILCSHFVFSLYIYFNSVYHPLLKSFSFFEK